MVEFYAPCCGHYQAHAWNNTTVITMLKKNDDILAKVNTTQESELDHEYRVIQGFPTVSIFNDGVHKP